MKLFDTLWAFFTSVKLAIFTLCALAVSSIVGTVVPQGKPLAFYIDNYGAKTAQFFHILNIPDMYSSWWFLGLLGLLSTNLLICSIDRLPAVLRIITADNLDITPERLNKMAFHRTWQVPADHSGLDVLPGLLRKAGWPAAVRRDERHELYFAQKNRWSRLGVYVVHLSILVIFTGAIIGQLLGFKASVMIPELRSTDQVYTAKDSSALALGFEVRCDSFTVDFYDNGMPKDYKSHLTILEKGRMLLQKDIEVNDPLTYRGITFYQASYEAYRDFILTITDKATGQSKRFVMPFQQQATWDDLGLQFGVINAEAMGQRAVRSKIWFKSGNNPPTAVWLADNASTSVTSGDKEYTLTAKQMYATGLQVAKDPGVWLVYLGCGLMMIGLYMAFFLTHKRIWLYKHVAATETTVYLAGSTNKNKPAFARLFASLETLVDQALQDGEDK